METNLDRLLGQNPKAEGIVFREAKQWKAEVTLISLVIEYHAFLYLN